MAPQFLMENGAQDSCIGANLALRFCIVLVYSYKIGMNILR